MQPAEHAGARPRVVVLYEVSREPLGLEPLEIEPLDNEPALVPVDVELDEQQAVEREACNFHVRRHSGGDIDVSPDSVDHSGIICSDTVKTSVFLTLWLFGKC